MKRTLARLLVCLAAFTGMVVVPGTPAHADTETCVGVGTFNILDGESMTYTTPSSRRFEIFMPSIGRCFADVGEFWFGTVTGVCGAASGFGYANARPAHDFVLQWVGSELLMIGDTATGVLTIAPNPFVDPNDCADPAGGRSWIGPGVLTLQHLPPL